MSTVNGETEREYSQKCIRKQVFLDDSELSARSERPKLAAPEEGEETYGKSHFALSSQEATRSIHIPRVLSSSKSSQDKSQAISFP